MAEDREGEPRVRGALIPDPGQSHQQPGHLRDPGARRWPEGERLHSSPAGRGLGGGSSLSRKPPYMSTAPQISPDTVLHLTLPESCEGGEERRDYSLEELKELLNKLMLMSGKKDHSGSEAEVFSEVGVLLPRAWELWGQRRLGWDWGAHC